MPHPDEGLIHAWLDGELDAAEAARVEALVANDPEWAAAAAEARGLIAASARIVGTLDRVPANVVPKAPAAAPRRAGHPWLWRAAAAAVLVAGSAVVLKRSGTDTLPEPKPATVTAIEPRAVEQQPAQKAIQLKPDRKTAAKEVPRARTEAPANEAVNAPAVTPAAGENKVTLSKKELAKSKPPEAAADKDVAAAGKAGARRADAAPAAAPAPVPAQGVVAERAVRAATPPAVGGQSSLALQQIVRMPASCWEQLQPADSARRIIRLEAGALDDSVRLERLTVRGDTLAAVHGRLTAIRVRCPAP